MSALQRFLGLLDHANDDYVDSKSYGNVAYRYRHHVTATYSERSGHDMLRDPKSQLSYITFTLSAAAIQANELTVSR